MRAIDYNIGTIVLNVLKHLLPSIVCQGGPVELTSLSAGFMPAPALALHPLGTPAELSAQYQIIKSLNQASFAVSFLTQLIELL